jgi:hypothetical protein
MRVLNCVPVVENGSVTVMAQDIGAALRALGADVRDLEYWPNRSVPESFPGKLAWLEASKDGAFVTDINAAFITTKAVAKRFESVEDGAGCFSFVTDTPLNFHSRLQVYPPGEIVGVVDSSFPALTGFMNYDRADIRFCPHAGPSVPSRILDTKSRDIDLIFIGNISKVTAPGDYANEVFENNRLLTQLFVTSFEALEPANTPFQTTLATARRHPRGYRRKDVAQVAVFLESYLSNVARIQTLSKLRDIEISVVGNIDDEVLAGGVRIRKLGFHPFKACLDLVARSKVLLNIVPSFPNGGHERIFYALSRGPAVLTTRSTFLEADRSMHGFVEFFDVSSGNVRERVLGLQEKLENGSIDRAQMLRHYERHHTWSRRLLPVLEEMRSRFGEKRTRRHG